MSTAPSGHARSSASMIESVATPLWLEEAIGAWRPRERLGGAEWAEKERVLSREESPSPGPWRSVPWQREILNALASTAIVWLVILKAAQVGASELIRCAIGRWALLDPGDVLWVMTTQDAAEASMRKLQAMFRATPALRPLLSGKRGDARLLQMILTNGMKITIGWAGSPQSMASDPQRYVILDEVAKYATQGKQGEADAVSFAGERTKVYGRRGKIVLLSSPKHDNDLICKNHRETSDRRVFAVACPSCGVAQALSWGAVRWQGGDPATAPVEAEARIALAAVVEKSQNAWLECVACHGEIRAEKATRDPRAAWVQDDGSTEGGGRRAYHVTELLHWETTLASLVAKFLRCVTPSQLQGFYNGSLGSPYRSETSVIPSSLFAARAVHAPRLVPAWATAVIATGDTQLRGYWYMIRAWGPASRSRLLEWGWADTGEVLVEKTLGATFPIEGRTEGGPFVVQARACMLAIDTGGGMERADGSRTNDAYRLVMKTPGAYAIKGEGDYPERKEARVSRVKIAHESFEQEIELHLLNRHFWADVAAKLVKCEAPVLWEECRGAESRIYSSQMASEQKVLILSESGSKELWQKRSQGAANHMWDLARYQCWAAEFMRVSALTAPTWPVAPQLQGSDEEGGWGTGVYRPRSQWS